MKCDLIIVGAGPAGSMAAKTSAEKGLDVVLLEKRQEIGVPVRCGEIVDKRSFSELITPDPSWIATEVSGARICAPDGSNWVISESKSSDSACYVLKRKIFDRALALRAAQAGADIMVKTRALGLLKMDGRPCGILALHLGKQIKIEAPLIIGADGIESKVGRWAGIETALKPEDIGTCAQFLIQDSSIDMDYYEFFLGNQSAPGGYVWSFPKGKDLANVGIGIQGSRSKPGEPLRLLKDFVRKKMPNAKILDLVVGGVPGSGPLDKFTADGIMLIGDAARQSDPLVGAGIVIGMWAGIIAGEVAANAIDCGDTKRAVLKSYEDRWQVTMGNYISDDYRLKKILTKLEDDDFNNLLHLIGKGNISAMGLIGVLRTIAMMARIKSVIA
jgi:digeranylgeranylglycerophospholipid reductase